MIWYWYRSCVTHSLPLLHRDFPFDQAIGLATLGFGRLLVALFWLQAYQRSRPFSGRTPTTVRGKHMNHRHLCN